MTVVAWLPFFFAVYSGYDVFGLVSCSAGRRTGIILYAVVRVFLGFLDIDPLKFPNAPGPFGDRGDTPRWGPMAGTAACTVTVSGAAGHKRGGVAETPLIARTQGRTVDCTFNVPPLRAVAGWFFCASCVFFDAARPNPVRGCWCGRAPSKGDEAQPCVCIAGSCKW